MLAIAALALVLLVVAEAVGASSQGSPTDWASVVKIVLGGMFVALATRVWSTRPLHGETPATAEWMARIDGIGGSRALQLGALVGGANVKNLLLTIAAVISIAQLDAPPREELAALAVYVAIAGLCVLAPVAYYLVKGESAKPGLRRLRAWLVANSPAILAVLFVVIGASLIGRGISELSQ
jgi:hypothetical protein